MSVILSEPVAELLLPIPGDSPCGSDMRHSGVYRQIRLARDSDDPGLPLGAWNGALKRADWPDVTRLCRYVLARHSKDLRVAAWLVEAWIRQDGFAALAPGLTLVEQLLTTYWDGLFPPLGDEGDDEGPVYARASCLEAVDKYLVYALRSVPLAKLDSRTDLTYGVWQGAAYRDDQLRRFPQNGRSFDDGQESMSVITRCLGQIEAQKLVEICEHLTDGLAASAALAAAIDRTFGGQAPDMTKHPRAITDIRHAIGAVLENRGIRPVPVAPDAAC